MSCWNWEYAFVFPLMITATGIVIDGYARLEAARLQERETVNCVVFNVSEEEALRLLILCHRRLAGLPAFCRVKLALPLANSLKEKALGNQQDGGKNKGSSKLTEAHLCRFILGSEELDERRSRAPSGGCVETAWFLFVQRYHGG
jgi:hypothetical protein